MTQMIIGDARVTHGIEAVTYFVVPDPKTGIVPNFVQVRLAGQRLPKGAITVALSLRDLDGNESAMLFDDVIARLNIAGDEEAWTGDPIGEQLWLIGGDTFTERLATMVSHHATNYRRTRQSDKRFMFFERYSTDTEAHPFRDILLNG